MSTHHQLLPSMPGGSSKQFGHFMEEIDLDDLSYDELNDLLEKVMTRLREIDAEEIKRDIVTNSQRSWLETAKE